MWHHYGRIPRTEDNTGEMIDIYINSNKQERDKSNKVYRITQLRIDTGKFDEYKFLIGFLSAGDAKEAYLIHYNSEDYFGGIKEFTLDQFKEALLKNPTVQKQKEDKPKSDIKVGNTIKARDNTTGAIEEVFISKILKNTEKERILEIIDPRNKKKIITLKKHNK